MGIEPTTRRLRRVTGFEDQGSHQTPVASSLCKFRGALLHEQVSYSLLLRLYQKGT